MAEPKVIRSEINREMTTIACECKNKMAKLRKPLITVKYKRNHKKIICWISSEAEHSSCKRKVRISKFLSSSNVSNILHIVFGSVKPLDYSIKTQLILFPCFWCVRENKVHLLYILYTPIAQLVEQQIFNLFVVGSIPAGRTK